jgi:hypothetical protein
LSELPRDIISSHRMPNVAKFYRPPREASFKCGPSLSACGLRRPGPRPSGVASAQTLKWHHSENLL